MVRFLVDDGTPDSDEFDCSYLSFDENDPQAIRRAIAALESSGHGGAGRCLRVLYAAEINDA